MCASWFLPYKYVHVYFCRVFYAYVSFSFYVTFLSIHHNCLCILSGAN
jgi:hypothetical protein